MNNFNKYLDEHYLRLLYNNYEDYYLKSIDEENFDKVYNILVNDKFTFINDIIIYYLEAFELDSKYIEQSLKDMPNVIGDNYQEKISNNLKLFDEVIKKAIEYSEEDN